MHHAELAPPPQLVREVNIQQDKEEEVEEEALSPPLQQH